MGPDGGIARLRVYGLVSCDYSNLRGKQQTIDLLAVENGGIALCCSNQHYGSPSNLILPGRGLCMGDGWETARQPNRPYKYETDEKGLLVLPGCDWSVLKLGDLNLISDESLLSHHGLLRYSLLDLTTTMFTFHALFLLNDSVDPLMVTCACVARGVRPPWNHSRAPCGHQFLQGKLPRELSGRGARTLAPLDMTVDMCLALLHSCAV